MGLQFGFRIDLALEIPLQSPEDLIEMSPRRVGFYLVSHSGKGVDSDFLIF